MISAASATVKAGSFQPMLARPKYTRKICTSSGVFRIASTYAVLARCAQATLLRRAIAPTVPMAKPISVAPVASLSVITAPSRNIGQRETTAAKSRVTLPHLPRHAVIHAEQRLVAVAALSVRARVEVLRRHESGGRQRHVRFLGLLRNQPQVLEHQVDAEAGGRVALYHLRPELVEHPR